MKGKLRNIKKFLISLLMITTIVVMGATVYAAPQTATVKPSPSQDQFWFDDGTIGNWYCREKGKPAVFKNEAGEVVNVAEYELLEDNLEMEPMTGYAYYEIKPRWNYK